MEFQNTHTAFRYVTDRQLQRNYRMFQAMNSRLLVSLGKGLGLAADRLKIPWHGLLRNNIFSHFCGGENLTEAMRVVDLLQKRRTGVALHYAVEMDQSEGDYDRIVQDTVQTFSSLKQSSPSTPHFGVVKLSALGPPPALYGGSGPHIEKLRERLRKICMAATATGCPLLIDAEHSRIQDTIDVLAMEMMEQFNRERVIVLNTVQMYRRVGPESLRLQHQTALKKGFRAGFKLVRGAYLEQELALAQAGNNKSPLWDSREETDQAYNDALTYCMSHSDVTLFAGTHNEKSAKLFAKLYKSAERSWKNTSSAQLYGMSDHITYNLALSGVPVCKYLPFGPVRKVVPFLIRRAEENTSVVGEAGRELLLLKKEMSRRSCL